MVDKMMCMYPHSTAQVKLIGDISMNCYCMIRVGQREETTRVIIRNNLLIKIFNNNFVRYCGSESTYYTFVRGKTGL